MPGAFPIRGRLYELGLFIAIPGTVLFALGLVRVEWTVLLVLAGTGIVIADVARHRGRQDE